MDESSSNTSLREDLEANDLKVAVESQAIYTPESVRAAWFEPISNEVTHARFYAALFAEFCATFFFVFATTSVANRFGNDTLAVEATNATVSLVFGFSIAWGVHTFGHISGAHFNPAVTFAMFVTLQISIFRLVAYVAVQLVGAMAASLVLYASLPAALRDQTTLGSNALAVDVGYTAGQGFAFELLGTALFVLAIFATVDPDKAQASSMGALAIGLAGSVAHFALVPVTGCGINPARSFGPNVIARVLTNNNTLPGSYWIYWVGPLLGGAVGALLYTLVFSAGQVQGLKRTFRAGR